VKVGEAVFADAGLGVVVVDNALLDGNSNAVEQISQQPSIAHRRMA
jgi:hypothetical protein